MILPQVIKTEANIGDNKLVDLMGEQLIEVVKAKHSKSIGYLLIGESRLIFADFYPKMVKVK